MIQDTWLLLRLRWQIGWNRFRKQKMVSQVLSVVGGIWLFVVVGGLSAAMGVGAGFALRQFPEAQLGSLIPGLILAGVAFILLLTSFGIALSSLFLSSDLELLMTAPVSRRAVFVSKVLDGMLLYYVLSGLLAFPALVMYGIGIGYGPAYLLIAVVALIGIPLLPAGLAAIIVIFIARFAPAKRVKEVLGVMGALFGISCGVLGQTSNIWFRNIQAQDDDFEAVLASLRSVGDLPIPPFIAGKALAAAGEGQWGTMLVYLGAFMLLTFGFFAGCVLLAENLYAAGWIRMQSSGSARRGRGRAARAATRSGLLGKAPAWLAIVLKDWRIVPRDLRNFAQMLSPLIFLPIVYLNVLNDGSTRRGGRNVPSPDSISFFGLGGDDLAGAFIAGGVLVSLVMVFGRIADTGISMEGKSWWLLKIAPISPVELLRGKYLTAYIPFTILATILMAIAAVWRGFDIGWSLYGLYGVLVLGAGLLAISTGMSVPWAKLDWEDPRKMGSWQGSVLSILGWAALGLLGGAFLCIPVFVQAFDPSLTWAGALVGGALAAAVSAGVGYLALLFGVSKLASVGDA